MISVSTESEDKMMQQNNVNYQNGQGNPPDLQNIPDNPYTRYYHEYLIDTGNRKQDEVPRPKRVASIFLCAISTMLMVSFCVMWAVFSYMSITTRYTVDFGIESSVGASVMLFIYVMPGSLATAIIAKVINRKSLWAVINLICIGVLFVTVIVIGFFLPVWGEKLNTSYSRNENSRISEDWNRDVEELLEGYTFDVADIDEDYNHLKGDPYEVRIFVSSEASRGQIDELNDFLWNLYKLNRNSRYRLSIKVYPCYYEPGNNSSFVYTKRIRFNSDSSPDDIDIEEVLFDDLENARRVPGHVPEELEQGNMLIVVR